MNNIKTKKFLFINHKSFGHSILDSFAIYEYYKNDCFILSLGEASERNSSLNWIIPPENLAQITLPSWHKRFRVLRGYLLRNQVGPIIVKILLTAKKSRLIGKEKQIKSLEGSDMLNLAPYHLKQYLGWSSERAVQYVQNRKMVHDVNGIQHSNGVGTQIFASVVNRIPDNALNIPRHTKELFFEFLRLNLKTDKIDNISILTLIISNRNKGHHGNGIARYLPALENLLTPLNQVVILLGDVPKDFRAIHNLDPKYKRVFTPEDFSLNPKAVEFLSIRYSRVVLGDPGGIWCVFLLLGEKGILVDQIPTGELINRCRHLPRLWVNEDQKQADLVFQLVESLFRLKDFSLGQERWKSRLRNATEVASLLTVEKLSEEFSTPFQIIDLIQDELAKELLSQNICSLTFS